jgi:hypothetical protein
MAAPGLFNAVSHGKEVKMYAENQDVQAMYDGDGQSPPLAPAAKPDRQGENGRERKLLPPRRRERLKAERVQDEMRSSFLDSHLAVLPGWRLKADGVTFGRVYELPDSRVALSFANFVSELAHSESLKVGLTLHGSRVGIVLPARVKDMNLAKLLNETMAFVQTMD